jgi:hypothetical protein
MPKVLLEMSVSLDGYVAGPDVSAEEPMGRGGEQLHRVDVRGPVEVPDERLSEVRTHLDDAPRGTSFANVPSAALTTVCDHAHGGGSSSIRNTGGSACGATNVA